MNYLVIPGLKFTHKRQLPVSLKFSDSRNIIMAVEKKFGISYHKMQSWSREQSLVHPRHVCMYLLSKHTMLTLREIGSLFNGRHHTTIIHAVAHMQDLMFSDERISEEIKELRNII